MAASAVAWGAVGLGNLAEQPGRAGPGGGGLRAGSVEVTTSLRYLVHVPSGYAASGDERWPLVLFLHGAGERGDDLERVKAWGPPKMAAAGEDLPYIMVAPQCPAGETWNTNTALLLGLLDQIESEYRVDLSRVYVTGLSMGGYGTWSLAAAAPERFAAIAPVCGGAADPFWRTAGLKDTPIWAFHGSEDTVVPVSASVNAVEAVRRAGGAAKLTVYEGVGHGSWIPAYEDEEFWEWFLSQTREVSP